MRTTVAVDHDNGRGNGHGRLAGLPAYRLAGMVRRAGDGKPVAQAKCGGACRIQWL